MRSKFTPIYAFFAISFLWLSFSGGQTGEYSGHPEDGGSSRTCASICHTGGGGMGSVQLENIPSTITPGNTYNLRLTINDVQQVAGGFQVLAAQSISSKMNFGKFTATGGESRIVQGTGTTAGRILHSTPKSISGGSVFWDIPWTADFSADPETPDEVIFYFVGNAVNLADGNQGDFVYNDNTAAIVVEPALAVNFLSFQTTAQSNGNILLQWEVANENETAYYEIERSEDGKIFKTIAMQSIDNQLNTYEYIDRVASKNKTFYYRIKEMATDGKTQLSTIQSVVLETAVAQVIAYPNPAITGQNVQLEIPSAFTGQLQIINLQGQIVTTQNIENVNISTIATTHLAAGTYSILLKNETAFYQQKLVILK